MGLKKINAMILFMALVLFLPQYKVDDSKKTNDLLSTDHVIETAIDNCYLCGSKSDELKSMNWGDNKIAVISVNTFEIMPIEIPSYSDTEAEMISKNQCLTIRSYKSKGDGFSGNITEVPSRGYASGTIYLYADETLNLKSVANFLCEKCQDKILSNSFGDVCLGIGIISFENREIRLFTKHLASFTIGDFFVSCNLKKQEKKDSSQRMDIVIFYCPIQYEKDT